MIAAALGWMGTVGTITAYLMLSKGHLRSESLRYGVLNFAGGLFGATATALYGAWPSVVSNVVWALVALHSVLTTVRARRHLWVWPNRLIGMPYVTEVPATEPPVFDGAIPAPVDIVDVVDLADAVDPIDPDGAAPAVQAA
jgi:hypothetical protein